MTDIDLTPKKRPSNTSKTSWSKRRAIADKKTNTSLANNIVVRLDRHNIIASADATLCVPRLAIGFTNPVTAHKFAFQTFTCDVAKFDAQTFHHGVYEQDQTLKAYMFTSKYAANYLRSNPSKSIKDTFLRTFGTEFDVRKTLVIELASAKQLNTLMTKVQNYAQESDIPVTYGPNTSPEPVNQLPPAVQPDGPLQIQLTKLRDFDDIDNDDFEPVAILLTGATYFLKDLLPGYIDKDDFNQSIPNGPPDHIYGYNATTSSWAFRPNQELDLLAFIDDVGLPAPVIHVQTI